LFHYDEYARYLVQNLKFGRRYPAARLLGTLLTEAIINRTNRPDAIIPMPLHPRRYRTRGFNQSLEIAKTVSQQTGLPYDISACRRIRFTPPQASLTAKERRSNLTDAFLCPRKLNYKSVVILDDVITTGSTVNELSRTLRQAGIDWIEIWSIARA
jgi:ComF family protein